MKKGSIPALIIIDMINDFVDERGALYVPSSKNIIEPIKEKIKWMREEGGIIVYVCDSHIEDDAEFNIWPPHAIQGSWGEKIVDELSPPPHSYIVRKRRYSGFFQTDLHLLLQEKKVEEVYLCGLLTDICVLHTAADAFMRGYKLFILKECVTALTEGENEWALKYMERMYKGTII